MNLTQLKSTPAGTLTVVTILFLALIAFEIFNFDTSRFALAQILAGRSFMSVSWAAILAAAFCAIDFAGLIRVFVGQRDPTAWYLLGAWLLGATGNALLTWLAVGTVVYTNQADGFLDYETLVVYAPIIVAALVWLTRILFIGSLASAGHHLFGENARPGRGPTPPSAARHNRPVRRPVMHPGDRDEDEMPDHQAALRLNRNGGGPH